MLLLLHLLLQLAAQLLPAANIYGHARVGALRNPKIASRADFLLSIKLLNNFLSACLDQVESECVWHGRVLGAWSSLAKLEEINT